MRMFLLHSKRSVMLVGLVAALFATAGAVRADEGAYRRLLKEKSPAVVTVKFVLKVSMGGMMGGMGDQESENEISGVLIDPKGLVLCSNTQLGGFTAMVSRMMGRFGGEMSATPTDLKVLVGDDTEGKEAELVARDTELDLAWVRIKEPGDSPLAHISLSGGAKGEIGQRLFALKRMGKYFGRSTVVVSGAIGGTTSKPRELYVPADMLTGALGLPVFNAEGTIVGVVVMQQPDAEDSDANPMAMLGNMMNMQEMMAGLILPAAEVEKATKRAMETAESK